MPLSLSPLLSQALTPWSASPQLVSLLFNHSPPDVGCWSTPRPTNNNPSYLITGKDLRVHASPRASPSGSTHCLFLLATPAHTCTLAFRQSPFHLGTNTAARHANTPSTTACQRGKRKADVSIHLPCSVKPWL